MKTSGLFKINLKDVGKAVAMLFITTFLTAVLTSVSNGTLPSFTELKSDALLGFTAAAAYLLKNLFTNNEDQLLKKDVQE